MPDNRLNPNHPHYDPIGKAYADLDVPALVMPTPKNLTVKANDLREGDVVFEPGNPEKRMYKVLQVQAVSDDETEVHVLDRNGSFTRILPNTVDYPIERPVR